MKSILIALASSLFLFFSSATLAMAPSDDEVDAFAQTAVIVQDIQEDFMHRIDGASEDERERMEMEAVMQIKSVADRNGLGIERYLEIVDLAQNDPAVGEQVNERFQQVQQQLQQR